MVFVLKERDKIVMKKICILLGSLNGIGGTGRAVSVLVKELVKEYAISIVCYHQDLDKIGYEIPQNIKIFSIHQEQKPMSRGIFRLIWYMANYLKREKVETLLVCGVLNMPGGIIAARIAGVKSICCDHSNYTCVYDAKFERESRNFAARFSDTLVLLTEKDIDNYKKGTTVRANLLAIPNLIDENLLNKMSEIKYNETSKRIISVGRLSYAKNYELLIEIAKEILDNNPGWSWDIYGSGELEETLKEKKELLNVERLQFKGNVKNIYDIYGEYSFLVMTSRYEGFPMVLIEAMANKLPCIAFDCQTGPSDIIIDGENGVLVEKMSKQDMIDGIQKIIDDVCLRKKMSNSTSKTIEKFAPNIILKKWKDII